MRAADKNITMNHPVRWDEKRQEFSGPGLIDLQVNGIKGIDFNDVTLKKEEVLEATYFLVSRGITTYFPTLITNSRENILSLIRTIRKAYDEYPLVRTCIGGLHLEGPFISKEDGARGAHDAQYVQAPDWKLLEQFQQAADGLIKMITMAPEWEGSIPFIKNCRQRNILVSLGHSLATTSQISRAVEAGLLLSTHLGNAVPLMLKRHPNLLWDQLAEEDLYTMIIADGHHIPDSFIKIVCRLKGKKTLLVSDATKFAGMPPGEYNSTIGGSVILDNEKKITLKGAGGLLAGAAKDLLENVETMIGHRLASLEKAWPMASSNVKDLLKIYFKEFEEDRNEEVRFSLSGQSIKIKQVIIGNEVLYTN